MNFYELKDRIINEESVRMYKKEFKGDCFDIIDIHHIGKESVFASDIRGDERIYFQSIINENYQFEDPRPKEEEEVGNECKKFDLENVVSVFLKANGSIVFALRGSDREESLNNLNSYEQMEV